MVRPETSAACTRTIGVRVVPGALSTPRTRFGMGVGDTMPVQVSVLNDQGRPLMSANQYLSWTVTPDSVLLAVTYQVPRQGLSFPDLAAANLTVKAIKETGWSCRSRPARGLGEISP